MYHVAIFIISVSRRGDLHEGTWRTLRVLEDLEDRIIIDVMGYHISPNRRYLDSFMIITLLAVLDEWGGPL